MRITFNEKSSLEIEPDKMIVKLSLTSNACKDKNKAISGCKSLQQRVYDWFESNDFYVGDAKSELKVKNFSVEPSYKSVTVEKKKGKDTYTSYDRQFIGYVASCSIILDYDLSIDLLTDIITQLKLTTKIRVSYKFYRSDYDSYESSVMKDVIVRAKKKAEYLCDSDKVSCISVDYTDVTSHSNYRGGVMCQSLSQDDLRLLTDDGAKDSHIITENLEPDPINIEFSAKFVFEC